MSQIDFTPSSFTVQLKLIETLSKGPFSCQGKTHQEIIFWKKNFKVFSDGDKLESFESSARHQLISTFEAENSA